MTLPPGSHELWPTPIGIHRYADAATVNPLLVRVFEQGRAAQLRKRGAEPGPFFASDDDLLHRVKVPEWQDFVRFLIDSLGETAKHANREAWAGREHTLKVGIEGMWFQFSRGGAFHDVHTHGNCSWSSAYIVQIDDTEARASHPVYGAANGVTRLYGPHFSALGGAFVDVGNAYLQPPHQDIEPVRRPAAAVPVLARPSGDALRRREGAAHHLLQCQHPRRRGRSAARLQRDVAKTLIPRAAHAGTGTRRASTTTSENATRQTPRDALTQSQSPNVAGASGWAAACASRRALARFLRVLTTLGCSGPNIRSRSASSGSRIAIASSGRSAAW